MFFLYRRKLELQAKVTQLGQRITDLQTEKVILEDRLKASLADRDRLWDLVTKSLDDMKYSYQSQINKVWQKEGEAAPYPEAAHMGDGKRYQMPDNPFKGKVMIPSALAQKQTQDFIKKYFDKEEAQG